MLDRLVIVLRCTVIVAPRFREEREPERTVALARGIGSLDRLDNLTGDDRIFVSGGSVGTEIVTFNETAPNHATDGNDRVEVSGA